MTALGDFISGDVLTAADLNAIGAWTSYTPALEASITDPTYTTAGGSYYVLNEIVIARAEISGFTSAGSGTYYLIMPTDVDNDTFPVAYGLYADGTSRYPIIGGKSGSGARRIFFIATYDNGFVNNSDPFTPGAADSLAATVIYKKA